MTQNLALKPKIDKDLPSPRQPGGGFKAKATALAVALTMLPVIVVGTTTYHFGSQSLNEQMTQARQIDDTGALESKLGRQKQLLEILSIGTAAIALLSAGLAALWARRTIGLATGLATTTAAAATAREARKELAERVEFFTDATEQIRSALNEEDILQAAVLRARRAIAADRVLVYSLDEQSRGIIVAESVAPRWPRAKGAMIDDPCFSASYFEKYENGRIQAVEDIYSVNLTPCHLGQLEPFAVKANLVVPILNQGKLMSLLIAHQCDGPRAWQQSEIHLFAHIAKQVGLALDRAKLMANSTNLQEQAEFLTEASEYICASLKEEDILQTAVLLARRVIATDRVLVYSLDEQSQGRIVAESVAPRWPRAKGTTIYDPCISARYFEKYQNGRIQAFDDIYSANLTPCHLGQLEPFAVKAYLVAPILNQDKLMGLLIAHQCDRPRAWQQSEIRLFARIAKQVGLALNNAKLLANFTNLQKQVEFLKDANEYICASLNEVLG